MKNAEKIAQSKLEVNSYNPIKKISKYKEKKKRIELIRQQIIEENNFGN